MARPRATASHLELTGQDVLKPQKYSSYNMTKGVVVDAVDLKPPKELSKEAKKGWNATVPALLQMQALSETDLVSLSNLFTIYDDIVSAKQAIKELDKLHLDITSDEYINKRRKLSGWLTTSVNSFTSIASRFGMTPTDRTRLPIFSEEEEEEGEDPLDIILG